MPSGTEGNVGTIAATERHDTLVELSAFASSGTFAPLERRDTFVGTTPPVMAAASPAEGHDAFAGTATCIVATISRTEDLDDLEATGGFLTAGSGAAAEHHDAFTAAAVGNADAGTLAGTGAADTASLGAVSAAPTRLFAVEGHDSAAISGVKNTAGSLAGAGRSDVSVVSAGLTASATLSGGGTDDTLLVGSGLLYRIYANTGIGDPINYATPVATTGLLSWTSSALAYPGDWKFGVRAYNPTNGLGEKNLDCAVEIILDAAGTDIANRPGPPSGLRGFPIA
jgi:hypothetical protein